MAFLRPVSPSRISPSVIKRAGERRSDNIYYVFPNLSEPVARGDMGTVGTRGEEDSQRRDSEAQRASDAMRDALTLFLKNRAGI